MKRAALAAALLVLGVVSWFVAEYYRPIVKYEIKKRGI